MAGTQNDGVLSPLAQRVHDDHHKHPTRAFYDLDALGSMFEDQDLELLDDAYRELETKGLVKRSGSIVSFFGKPKPLYLVAESREAA